MNLGFPQVPSRDFINIVRPSLLMSQRNFTKPYVVGHKVLLT